MSYQIPQELLTRYVKLIKLMEELRSVDAVSTYASCEGRRADLHEQILKACGATRNDEGFALSLATLVDEMLEVA